MLFKMLGNQIKPQIYLKVIRNWVVKINYMCKNYHPTWKNRVICTCNTCSFDIMDEMTCWFVQIACQVVVLKLVLCESTTNL